MRQGGIGALLAANLVILVATSPAEDSYSVTDSAPPVAIELSPEIRSLLLSGTIEGGPDRDDLAVSLAFEGLNSAPESARLDLFVLEEGTLRPSVGDPIAASFVIDASASGTHEVEFVLDTNLYSYGDFQLFLDLTGDAVLEGEITVTATGWADIETEGQSIEISDITVEELSEVTP